MSTRPLSLVEMSMKSYRALSRDWVCRNLASRGFRWNRAGARHKKSRKL